MKVRLPRRVILASLVLLTSRVIPAAAGGPDEDRRTLAQYKLTLDNLKRLTVALRSLVDLVEKDPKIAQQMSGPEQETLEEAIRRIESNATFAGALKAAGISARDYLLSSVAVVVANAVQDARKSDPKTPIPPEVAPENLALVQAHGEDVAAVLRELDRFAEKTGIH